MVLVFSMIGMKSKEVPVGKQREFKITLTEEKSELEEVVVTGIVERKAESFTYRDYEKRRFEAGG